MMITDQDGNYLNAYSRYFIDFDNGKDFAVSKNEDFSHNAF